ncbi:hypothetical protein pb186bvf_001812 [Paramecium bursaria]
MKSGLHMIEFDHCRQLITNKNYVNQKFYSQFIQLQLLSKLKKQLFILSRQFLWLNRKFFTVQEIFSDQFIALLINFQESKKQQYIKPSLGLKSCQFILSVFSNPSFLIIRLPK